jgi:glycosyltransferase involved in cell wall biosynthesis
VIAIGRLVEKKGFARLLEAAAELGAGGSLERLVIVGEGPLRGELEAMIERLDLRGVAELAVAWGAAEVRAQLEAADVLAAPSVIAADGDRDAMPVVVKEALAMEVPVVTTDVAGLPELVRPQWGRMVAPDDPAALAAALAEVLTLPAEGRRRMGTAGREFVVASCDLRREAAKLASLVGARADGPGPGRGLV